MAMILSGVPNYMVMLIGHWKLDAFLIYIHKQLAEFTKSVSQKMITTTTFFHLLANTLAFTSRSTMAGQDVMPWLIQHISSCLESGSTKRNSTAAEPGDWMRILNPDLGKAHVYLAPNSKTIYAIST
jgi:hypothetical protein